MAITLGKALQGEVIEKPKGAVQAPKVKTMDWHREEFAKKAALNGRSLKEGWYKDKPKRKAQGLKRAWYKVNSGGGVSISAKYGQANVLFTDEMKAKKQSWLYVEDAKTAAAIYDKISQGALDKDLDDEIQEAIHRSIDIANARVKNAEKSETKSKSKKK